MLGVKSPTQEDIHFVLATVFSTCDTPIAQARSELEIPQDTDANATSRPYLEHIISVEVDGDDDPTGTRLLSFGCGVRNWSPHLA